MTTPVRFGTSGWRGILGDEVNARRTAAAVSGVVAWLRDAAASAPVVVAHDRRPCGEQLSSVAAQVIAGAGFEVIRTRGATPTPAVARYLATHDCSAGLVFTASHNAASDHGLKVLDSRGASAPTEVTRRIESAATLALDAASRRRPGLDPASPRRPGLERASPRRAVGGRRVDLAAVYRRDLVRQVDRSVFRGGGLRVAFDAMHGAAAGVLDAAFLSIGVGVDAMRLDRDVRFGGQAPDPRPARLVSLARRVAKDPSLALGLATDGDGDRFAVTDARGRFLSETQAIALLIDHLARRGRIERGVAISIATGSLVERVAAERGLRISRHPIGFKYLAEALAAGEADAAGEESGGFALGSFSRDKDGMLAGCLVAELAAREPVAEALARIERRHGRSACGRIALAAGPHSREALDRLVKRPPDRVAGSRVREIERRDGLRLVLEDGFIMLRASGTESVLRVYAEAPSGRVLRGRLAAGAALLDGAWTPPARADTL